MIELHCLATICEGIHFSYPIYYILVLKKMGSIASKIANKNSTIPSSSRNGTEVRVTTQTNKSENATTITDQLSESGLDSRTEISSTIFPTPATDVHEGKAREKIGIEVNCNGNEAKEEETDVDATIQFCWDGVIIPDLDKGRVNEAGVKYEQCQDIGSTVFVEDNALFSTPEFNGKRSFSDPVHSIRPYGLPSEMKGSRRHIWELVLGHVHDLDSIVSLHDVCVMFNELLKRKYVSTILPWVMWNQFANGSITWEGGKKDWLKTLATLRLVSRASKHSVDALIDRGMVGKDGTNWFSIKKPHYLIKTGLPILQLGASGMGQRRLQRMLKQVEDGENLNETFPLRALILDKDGHEDNRIIVDPFETVIKEIGNHITSFLYRTEEKSFVTYCNLKRWVAFMPNLQDLIVDLTRRNLLEPWEKTGVITVKPFPICRRLKRYAEGPNGFGVLFLTEILRANPTIQEVILGEVKFDEWKHLKNALDTLQLTKFHITCIPDCTFFEEPFHWARQLTTLALWDPTDNWMLGLFDIPSEKFFNFLSSLENLRSLVVSSPRYQGKGGCANLPKLEYLMWKVFPTMRSLEFLKSAKNLKFLALDLSKCPDIRREEDLMEFLKEWSIPSLHPVLKRIRVRTNDDGPYETIWKKGSA